MKKTHLSLLIGLILSIFVIVTVTIAYPNNDDLWIENPFWNGLTKFYAQTEPRPILNMDTLRTINPSETTFFIIGPSKDFTNSESQAIMEYITNGGNLIILDDFGTANQLLEDLNIDIRFTKEYLMDPIFRENNKIMPLITIEKNPEVNEIVLNIPTSLIATSEEQILASSSPYSFTVEQITDSPSDFYQSPVILQTEMGNGYLTLLSDSSIFINSMIDRGDNEKLLNYLSKGDILIDEIHRKRSPLTVIQEAISNSLAYLEYYEARYLIAIISLGIISTYKSSITTRSQDEVDVLLKTHPEYSRETLEKLNDERKKIDR